MEGVERLYSIFLFMNTGEQDTGQGTGANAKAPGSRTGVGVLISEGKVREGGRGCVGLHTERIFRIKSCFGKKFRGMFMGMRRRTKCDSDSVTHSSLQAQSLQRRNYISQGKKLWDGTGETARCRKRVIEASQCPENVSCLIVIVYGGNSRPLSGTARALYLLQLPSL